MKTCKEVKERCPTAPSGYYWLRGHYKSHQGGFKLYCDMDTETGT